MWAQAMIEHGLLSGAAAGASAVQYQIEALLADGTTRWFLAGGLVALAYFLLRRR
jgi:hypothetical protein